MNQFGTTIILILGTLISQHLQASVITCYNDDSRDIINQNMLTPNYQTSQYLPPPQDCNLKSVRIDADKVYLDEKLIFEGWNEGINEVRVSPEAVVIFTSESNLFVYKNGQTSPWKSQSGYKIVEFRMARDGSILAKESNGGLMSLGSVISEISRVKNLYAAYDGSLFALMEDGSIYNFEERIYDGWKGDRAIDLKMTPNGLAVWRTENGKIYTSERGLVYDGWIDPATSLKLDSDGVIRVETDQKRTYLIK